MAKNLVLNRTRKVPAEDTAAFGAIAERFRRAGALERAVELCREGLQKFPDHISARVTLGWSLLDLGKYDDARVELEQVLRRAPDNLAAIRGLAELHDRFEHTLHLPMDGPGQWPPPPESVDSAGGGEASASDQEAADTDLEMTPAALGIPIWSPAGSPAPSPEPPVAAVTPVAATVEPPPIVATAPTPAPAAPPTPKAEAASKPSPAAARKAKKTAAPPPAPEAATAPAPAAVAAAVATPAPVATPAEAPAPVAPAAAAAVTAAPAAAVSEPPKVEATTSGSGMSSVREIDFGPTLEAREEPAKTTEVAADAYAVSDADIQALIAEADSLDAAAGAEAAPSTAVSYSSVTEPISVDLDLDAAPADIEAALEITEPAAESTLEAEEIFEAALEVAAPLVEAALVAIEEQPVVAADPPVEVAVAAPQEAEELFEAALEVAAPVLEAAIEIEDPVVVAQVQPVVAPEPEPKPEIRIAAAVDVSPAVEEVPAVDLVGIEVAPALEALVAAEVVELAPVAAAAAEVVSIEVGRTAARSPVPALERLLAKVQARKAQLMAESVA